MKEVRVGSICAIGLLALIAPSSLSLYRPICDSWCLGSFYRNKEVEIAIIWWDSSICVRSALLSRPFSLCVWWSPPVHLSPIADGLVSSIGHTQNVQSLNALDLTFSLCVVSWKKQKKKQKTSPDGKLFPVQPIACDLLFSSFRTPTRRRGCCFCFFWRNNMVAIVRWKSHDAGSRSSDKATSVILVVSFWYTVGSSYLIPFCVDNIKEREREKRGNFSFSASSLFFSPPH